MPALRWGTEHCLQAAQPRSGLSQRAPLWRAQGEAGNAAAAYFVSWQPLRPAWWPNHKVYVCHQIIIEHHRISINRGDSLIHSTVTPPPQHKKPREESQDKQPLSNFGIKLQIKVPTIQLHL